MSAVTHIDFTTVSETANPLGLPAGWPAEQRGIRDESAPMTYPINHRLTWTEFLAYLEPMRPAYDVRVAQLLVDEEAAQLVTEQVTRDANEPDMALLRDQAQAAINANITYLALSPPNNAQVIVQVQRLTQQNIRIIRALVRLVIQGINS